MRTRKIVLLSAIAALVVVYVLQLVFSGGTAVKDFNLAESPDALTITKGVDGTPIKIVKDGENWLVGEKQYPADKNIIESLVNEVKNVKVLGTVSKSSDNERYGLDDANVLIVKASKDGKDLRTLNVGKKASTSQQTYIQLDGSKEVLLASGNKESALGKSIEDMRDKGIYSVNVGDIMKISVAKPDESYSLEKTGEPPAWTLTSSNTNKIDVEKVSSWVGSITSLKAQSYAAEDTKLPSVADASVTLTAAGKDITVSVYKAEESKYLCASNITPYVFYLSSYTAEKYVKALKDLSN